MPTPATLAFTIAFACLVNACLAQTSIQVKAAEDRRPLAFASVVNHTTHSLQFADENGVAKGRYAIGDSLSISYVGYRNASGRVASLGVVTFFLKQAPALMPSVQLFNCTVFANEERSNLQADTGARRFGGVVWDKSSMQAKIAVMLRPDVEDARLQAFSIWLRHPIGAPKSAIKAPLIFSFYSIDTASMLPGELLSNQAVLYHPKKEGRQTIRIDTLGLRIPVEGMYVCIEYAMTDSYQWPMRHLDVEKGIDSVVMRHGAVIDGVRAPNFPLAFFNYERNHWFFPMKRSKASISEVQGTIKFSVQMAVCKVRKKA